MATVAQTPQTTQPQPSVSHKATHRYCSWAFFKPILVSLGLLLASLTTLGLVIASGVTLSLGIGIVLAIQIVLAGIALVLAFNHIRQFKQARTAELNSMKMISAPAAATVRKQKLEDRYSSK
ncbi:hypothetical protein CPK_ORF00817 [Chlamydia pneumoniae LPCoLN]|uniref:hypothetical protein n=1 Tax=Chlamydia pneumoniae TaxID=83558 RepID=UPI0001BD9C85|nr:hypothetical protein [Chlamydia pneumoniae]ACZ33284.1 hypothetical protein CPK_ORF00817 [Chlamydia pneumoniae LPCoLN]ETR80193.1 hypothetical protein X556_0485 [Chlamydia pneumoniae B21]